MSCPKCGAEFRFNAHRNFSPGPSITIEKYCDCEIELRITYVDGKYIKIDGLNAKVWY